MLWFIIGLAVLIFGVLWAFAAPGKTFKETTSYNKGATREEVPSLKPFASFPIVGGLALVLIACCSVVGTREVGVETVFSHPTGKNYNSGLVIKPPWANVHDIDGAIQPEEYKGGDCIDVKIGDGGTSCVSIAYRWRINPTHASDAYANYHNASNGVLNEIRTAIVSTNVDAALNEVFGKWNPLNEAKLNSNMTPQQLANAKINVIPDYETFSQDVKVSVEKKLESLGGLVEVESVTISYVQLPSGTQDRINAFNQAVQNTRIALQNIATQNAQAQANRKLAASLRDPAVLVSKCFDGLISGDIKNEPGFSCWGNSGAVVVPSK